MKPHEGQEAQESARPRWLITGASGLLGWNAWLDLKISYDTFPCVRGQLQRMESANCVYLELSNDTHIQKVIRGLRPDVVFHGAALASHELCQEQPSLAFDINVRATKSLAQACQSVGSKLIYVSTDAVFDGQRGDYKEIDPPDPFSVYGETKLLGEEAATLECERTLVIRTNFFGWSRSGHRSILEFFVSRLSEGLSTPGFTDFRVTSLYVEHVIKSVARLAEADVSGIVHVASSDSLSKYEFGLQVAEVFGFRSELVQPRTSSFSLNSPTRARNLSLNTDLLTSIQGPPATQREGLVQALNSTRRQIPLKGRTHDDI